jgi:tetratricopeptide (TPR) repeat protein
MTRAPLLAAIFFLAAAGPNPAKPLLDALKTAPTDQQAAALEQQINLVWRAAITPSVQLLADRAMMSLAHQDPKTAIGDLDAAVDLQPEQALLWRLHAEARFANGDTSGAYADLAQALAREPRCFPALVDLSHFAEAGHDYKRALEAWQQLLTIDPKTPHAAGRLEALERQVSGEPL